MRFVYGSEGLPVSRMLDPLFLLGCLWPAVFLVLFFCVYYVHPAIQAQRRGYSFFAWFLAGLFVLNPLLILVMLMLLPNAKRQRQREEDMKDIEARLAAAASAHAGKQSVGDQGRALSPPPASIGDVETRP